MTDLAAEAALVAEELGEGWKTTTLSGIDGSQTVMLWGPHGLADNLLPQWGAYVALVSLARRLREVKQERDEWRAEAKACVDTLKTINSKLAVAELYAPAAAVAGTGPSGVPADHITGGYRVAKSLSFAEQKAEIDRRFEEAKKFAMTRGEPTAPEPAYDPPEPCDGTASVPVRDWWDDDRGWKAEGLRRAEGSFG